jgi:hypothetical protein
LKNIKETIDSFAQQFFEISGMFVRNKPLIDQSFILSFIENSKEL